MGIEPEYIPILASARFTFIGIADDIFRVRRVGIHETPFQARGEPCAATTAQARALNFFRHVPGGNFIVKYFFPGHIAINPVIILQGPGLVVFEGSVTDRVDCVPVHYSSPSSTSSTLSGVRFS